MAGERLRERIMSYTKDELVKNISNELELPQMQVSAVVSLVFDNIARALADGSGQKVAIAGFGHFYAKERTARKGRNPRTREVIDIPASITPRFRAGSELKRIVNKE